MQNGTVTVGRVGYPGHQCVEVLHHAVLRKQTVELDTANQYIGVVGAWTTSRTTGRHTKRSQ